MPVDPFKKSSCSEVDLPKVAARVVGFDALQRSGDATVKLIVWVVVAEAVSVPVKESV